MPLAKHPTSRPSQPRRRNRASSAGSSPVAPAPEAAAFPTSTSPNSQTETTDARVLPPTALGSAHEGDSTELPASILPSSPLVHAAAAEGPRVGRVTPDAGGVQGEAPAHSTTHGLAGGNAQPARSSSNTETAAAAATTSNYGNTSSSSFSGSASSAATALDQQPTIFSFSAGGWCQMYMFGAAQALKAAGVATPDAHGVKYAGASAGALAACALAGNFDLFALRNYTLDCGDHCRASYWHTLFFLKDYVLAAVSRFGAGPMSYDAATGTTVVQDRLKRSLEIFATTLPYFKLKKFDTFTCLEDIEEALLASLCIAPLFGLPFKLRESTGGEWVCDGGISAFQPHVGEPNVITISPLYWTNARIKPSQPIPLWWAIWPPKRREHSGLFDLGYNDTLEFLVREGFAPPSLMALRRPRPHDARRHDPFVMVRDVVAVLCTYFVFRPLAIAVVYVEMAVLAVIAFVRAALSRTDRAAFLVELGDRVRNMISLRVFLHLLVSSRVPINEGRLAKRSRAFRLLEPMVFPPRVPARFRETDDPLSDGEAAEARARKAAARNRAATATTPDDESGGGGWADADYQQSYRPGRSFSEFGGEDAATAADAPDAHVGSAVAFRRVASRDETYFHPAPTRAAAANEARRTRRFIPTGIFALTPVQALLAKFPNLTMARTAELTPEQNAQKMTTIRDFAASFKRSPFAPTPEPPAS